MGLASILILLYSLSTISRLIFFSSSCHLLSCHWNMEPLTSAGLSLALQDIWYYLLFAIISFSLLLTNRLYLSLWYWYGIPCIKCPASVTLLVRFPLWFWGQGPAQPPAKMIFLVRVLWQSNLVMSLLAISNFVLFHSSFMCILLIHFMCVLNKNHSS